MIMPKERVLLDRLIEEALDQPNPTKGLRQATQDCSNYQLARALKARAKNAARVRRYKFKKSARQQKPAPESAAWGGAAHVEGLSKALRSVGLF